MPNWIVKVSNSQKTFTVNVSAADQASAIAVALAVDLSAATPDFVQDPVAIPVQQVGEPWVSFPDFTATGINDPHGTSLTFRAALGTVFTDADRATLAARVAAAAGAAGGSNKITGTQGGAGSAVVTFTVQNRNARLIYAATDIPIFTAPRP